jgi:hypothetical protein
VIYKCFVIDPFFSFFETGSRYVAQAGLELVILLPHPPDVGITGMHHHAQL